MDVDCATKSAWSFFSPDYCIVEGYSKPPLVLRGDGIASQLLNSFLGPV